MTIVVRFECPTCGVFGDAEGVRIVGGGMQIKCPDCQAVEVLPPPDPTLRTDSSPPINPV